MSRTEPEPVRDNNFLKKMRFGIRKNKARRRQKKKKNAEEANRQRREQKDTSKTHPGESTGQFCEHDTLSEVICLEKDVFGTQFGEFALSNL